MLIIFTKLTKIVELKFSFCHLNVKKTRNIFENIDKLPTHDNYQFSIQGNLYSIPTLPVNSHKKILSISLKEHFFSLERFFLKKILQFKYEIKYIKIKLSKIILTIYLSIAYKGKYNEEAKSTKIKLIN